MAQQTSVSASFIQRHRDVLVENMKKAYVKQASRWSGSSCIYVPSSLSDEQRKAEWNRQQQNNAEAEAASAQAATWAAEQVRRHEDPENDLGLHGWSIVRGSGGPELVNQPIPANCIRNSNMFYRRKAAAEGL